MSLIFAGGHRRGLPQGRVSSQALRQRTQNLAVLLHLLLRRQRQVQLQHLLQRQLRQPPVR